MENSQNTPSASPQANIPDKSATQTPSSNQPTPTNISGKQEMYERLLLGIGVVALISLLLGNATILQLAAACLLIVAIVSIVRNSNSRGVGWLLHSKKVRESSEDSSNQNTSGQTTKKITPLKLAVIILAVIILAPAIIYFGFFVLMILLLIVFSIGGGETSGS